MAVWSEASNRAAIEGGRMDAEFFHPAFLDAHKVLASCSVTAVSKYFFISDGNHLEMSRYFTEGAGTIPYFRGQDLSGFFLRSTAPVRIPRTVYERVNMRRSHFLPEDVLLCIVGASTGTVALVSADDTPCTGSCKIGILRRRRDGSVDPYFLSAFLQSKYGQFQIRRHSRGTAQGGLILKDIFKLLVPRFAEDTQQEVRALVEASLQNHSEANSAYESARCLLESRLGLEKLTSHKPAAYSARFSTINVSETFAANRVDAQCFSPDAIFYDLWLRARGNCARLGSLVEPMKKGRHQADTPTGVTNYCSIKHLGGREVVNASKSFPSSPCLNPRFATVYKTRYRASDWPKVRS